MTAKPTVSGLGIDPAAQVWHRSGRGDGSIEVAFARAGDPHAKDAPKDGLENGPENGTEWVLMRVAGDPDQRVLVFDRHEWECFLDGARNGEFDDAAGSPLQTALTPGRTCTLICESQVGYRVGHDGAPVKEGKRP